MPPATYAGDRRIIDVDSHVIELDDFLWNTATPSERKRLPKMANQKVLPGYPPANKTSGLPPHSHLPHHRGTSRNHFGRNSPDLQELTHCEREPALRPNR